MAGVIFVMDDGFLTAKPFVNDAVCRPVVHEGVLEPRVVSGLIIRLATTTVGLVTDTGPNPPTAAPPTEMPEPKLQIVVPCKKSVFDPVIVTESDCPGGAADGLT